MSRLRFFVLALLVLEPSLYETTSHLRFPNKKSWPRKWKMVSNASQHKITSQPVTPSKTFHPDEMVKTTNFIPKNYCNGIHDASTCSQDQKLRNTEQSWSEINQLENEIDSEYYIVQEVVDNTGHISAKPQFLRPRRSSLESQISFKHLLSHKPPPSGSGANYPKDFAFKDYVRSTAVKRLESGTVGVVVMAKEVPHSEDKATRRRHAKRKNKVIALPSEVTASYSLLGDKDVSETHLTINKTNFTDKWTLSPGSSNHSYPVQISSESINKETDNINSMSEEESVIYVNVIPAQKIPSSDKESEPNTTSRNRHEIKLPLEHSELTPLVYMDMNAVRDETKEEIIKNETINFPNDGETSDLYNRDWKSNIYRGTIIDTRTTLQSRPTNMDDDIKREGEASMIHPTVVNISGVDASSQGLGVSERGDSYVNSDNGTHSISWPTDVYRGTVIDVAEYSRPALIKVNKGQSKTEDETDPQIVTEEIIHLPSPDAGKTSRANEAREGKSIFSDKNNSPPSKLEEVGNIEGIKEIPLDTSSSTKGVIDVDREEEATSVYPTLVHYAEEPVVILRHPIVEETENTTDTVTVNDFVTSIVSSDIDVFEGVESEVYPPLADNPHMHHVKRETSTPGAARGLEIDGGRGIKRTDHSETDTKVKKSTAVDKHDVNSKEWLVSVYRGIIVDVSKPKEKLKHQPVELAEVAGPPYVEL